MFCEDEVVVDLETPHVGFPRPRWYASCIPERGVTGIKLYRWPPRDIHEAENTVLDLFAPASVLIPELRGRRVTLTLFPLVNPAERFCYWVSPVNRVADIGIIIRPEVDLGLPKTP